MAWITPKTDWTADDYLNYTDFNRITGNISHLKTMVNSLFASSFGFGAMGNGKVQTSIPYAIEFNNIEANLQALNLNSYNFDFEARKTSSINGATPTYEDINRIESACLRLYETLTAHQQAIPHLAMRLGDAKTFRVGRR